MLNWDAEFAAPAQAQNLPMKHLPWDFQAGCVYWEYPEVCAITPYRGNNSLEIFNLPFTQSLKSTLKNRSCDPIFQGHD